MEPLEKVAENVAALRQEISELKTSVAESRSEVKACNERVTKVEIHLERIDMDIHERDQWSRMNNVEVKGVPQGKNENLFNIMKTLGDKINYKIDKSYFNFYTRVQSMDPKNPKPIIACFHSRYVKEDFIAAARLYMKSSPLASSDLGLAGNSRIFVNDHLTARNKDLLAKAKKAAREMDFNINHNFDEFEALFAAMDTPCEIIILTECWLLSAPYLPTLSGYTAHGTIKHLNQNSGIVIYVKDSLDCKVYEPDCIKEANCLVCEICNIFKFWYQNQINVVKWSDGISDAYRLECGVRQGGITSPKLFNLYVNDLIVGLSSMRVGCSIDGVVINNISYADDMVLLGPTTKSINEMLRVCESFAAEHGLVYNVEKCVCMVFGVVGKCPRNTPPMFLSGKELKIVKTFKYLGHVLADDLKDDDDIERERRALAVRGNMLARRFARCSDQVKITLFKAFCQGFYTGGLWVRGTKRSLDALRIQYNNIFRMLLRLPKFCSASEMFAQTRTDGFHAVIRKKMASLIRRIRSSGNTILRTVADRYDSPIIRHLVRGTMPVALHGQL
ncbi:uncharacterized protein LOC132904218 [Amyelois transitella]|uniref:uncharacterized protein LOC132904218 n=1 Tax=Amyelois transitella TaxID=680683 RepID=UPI00298FB9CB|nr:uncharacterized protein LOC132904218 [Amyelois transitella]